MGQKTLSVTGMSCGGCEQNVTDALEALDGVESAEADNETDTVEIVADESVSDEQIQTTIEDAGYDVLA